MTSMVSKEVEARLHAVFTEAQKQRHQFVTVEHLLLALLDTPSVDRVLRACSANTAGLRASLSSFIQDNIPLLDRNSATPSQPTLGFQRVVQRAVMSCMGKKEVAGDDVLRAIFGENNSHAVYYLQSAGVTQQAAMGCSDLQVRCKEVQQWEETGLATGHALKRLAATLPGGPGRAFAQAVEQTKREAMEFVAACPAMHDADAPDDDQPQAPGGPNS